MKLNERRRSSSKAWLRKWCIGAVLVSCGFPALSGDIKGAGASTCGTWIEDRKNGTWYPQMHWVQGYLSAYNVYAYKGRDSNGVFGHTDSSAIAVWLDNYCQKNPLNVPAQGMRKLIEELEQQQR